MDEKIKRFLWAVIAIVILGGLWLTRPIWHWLFMAIYIFPSLWESLIVAVVVAGVSYVFWRSRKDLEAREKAVGVFVAVLVISLVILSVFAVMYPQCYLSENLRTSKITELPDIDPSAVRIMPRAVAERYARDALQYPQFKLGTGDISFLGKTPHWVYGLIPNPDGVVNFFVLKDKGAVYVDMTTSRKNTKIVEKEMQIGEGMGITDWYKWELYNRKYWVDYEDPYFVFFQGELYIVVPVVSYEYYWRFPTFYTVPQWQGVALINSEGDVEFLTPEQAREHPVLKNQKLYPERLARYYVDSFRYIHGIINTWFYHKDELQIADVPGQQNEQPFLVVTKEGMKWLIACEPFGKETHGIFRIYLLDAQTGEIQFYEPPAALIGPVKACNYVRKANPTVDWNRMIPVEPIPVITNKSLYWHVRVIPNDASGIAYTAMVNAETGEVIELKTDESVKDFLKEEYKARPEIPETGKNVTAIIIIREDSKEIQRIQLLQNQTIEVIPVS